MAKQKVAPKPKAGRYFRDHADFVMHLAVQLAEMSAAEIAIAQTNGTPCDINRAQHEDVTAAREILKRAGVRTRDESPPSWHFAKPALSRATPEPQTAGDVPMEDIDALAPVEV